MLQTIRDEKFHETGRGFNFPAWAIVPIGPIEEHGPHLPVTTDIDTAAAWARLVAERDDRFIVLPPVPLMLCGISADTCGTFRVMEDALVAAVTDLVTDLAGKLFDKVLFLTGHGGYSMKVMREKSFPAAHKAVPSFGVKVLNFEEAVPEQDEIVGTSSIVLPEGVTIPDCHAAGIETSRVLAILGRKYIAQSYRRKLPPADFPSVGEGGKLTLSESGIWGDPRLATLDKGRQITDLAVQRAVEWLHNDNLHAD